jgi:2-amino-4-hydroxy-6-hydroxymethyldihydropteridine diphosphokinase
VVRAPVTAYIALGANLGDPGAALIQAMDDMAAISGITLIKRSSLYQTAPLEASGPDYVNAVVEIQTVLTAPDLLIKLQELERAAGRERSYLNAPRTLDIDILTYGDARVNSQALVIPHPRMNARAFVLLPLAEIAPRLVTQEQLRAVQSQLIQRLTGDKQ